MKLSTLYEARDPKKEAEFEPKLTAPFYRDNLRRADANRKAREYIKQYGLPEPQFMPNPNYGEGGKWDQLKKDQFAGIHSWGPHQQTDTFGDKFSADKTKRIIVPVTNYGGRVRPTQNVTNTGDTLNKSIAYWMKDFKGQRWPALEQAFLNRDWTFKGGRGMYDSARSSLFKYLNNLSGKWPEGEKMADQVLASRNGLMYVRKSPDIRKYVEARPALPSLTTAINAEIKAHEQRMADYKIKHDEWLKSQAPPDEFHADDRFDRFDYEPQPPNWRYGNEEWFRAYAAGKYKPGPTEEEQFQQRLREIGEQPPFANWA